MDVRNMTTEKVALIAFKKPMLLQLQEKLNGAFPHLSPLEHYQLEECIFQSSRLGRSQE